MFLILEIVSDKGEKEWKIAPKRWVCTSKTTQRPVLFWPDEFSVERQNQLAIEGTCKPLQSWRRKECVIRQEFPTYEKANDELQALLIQQCNQIKVEPEDPMNIEDPAVESLEPPCVSISAPDEDISTLVTIKSMLESLITKNALIEKQNVDVVQQNYRIESILFNLQKGVQAVESKFTASVLIPDNSCTTPEETIRQQSSEEKFSLEPMETAWQLQELENKLNDESFHAELVQWLLSNVNDDNTTLRMERCMDLLCSLKLQLKINWVWVVELKNVFTLLMEVGETSLELVTFSSAADFLKKYLSKHSLEKKRGKSIFKHIESAEQLRELEMKLNDESFNAELLEWLLCNVKDKNTNWRIKSCLDLLCSIELQSKLRWSRIHGSILKEPINELPNFLDLFKVVGKTPSEDVTHSVLAKCFKSHLHNSHSRFLRSLKDCPKRASKWRVRKRGKSINGVVSENVDSSNATKEK
ncbi:uncharacterized protein LOC125951755 isoform X7 [Anopheles darlingi]|uniref:uncharacterized protein LOC125951755 isoform X7 n=1 Tax=Anopheles darlingi TaxID=43151 RepID=UPI0020FFFC91|nr:uncharacterized protein LOC125951755 isoform X7 [Anopheles darlingi]